MIRFVNNRIYDFGLNGEEGEKRMKYFPNFFRNYPELSAEPIFPFIGIYNHHLLPPLDAFNFFRWRRSKKCQPDEKFPG